MIKPYFETKNGVLYHADCMEVMRDMEDNSVDLVLTDIPYGKVNRGSNGLRGLDKGVADIEDYQPEDLAGHFAAVSSGSVYSFCGTEQVSFIRRALVDVGMSTRLCIWEKLNPSPMNGQRIWLSGIETCVYGKHPKATFNAHCRNTVWRFKSGDSIGHPTRKPINLFKFLVETSSNHGDTVLDPFLGSGTTAIACEQLGRKWIGVEREEQYCEIAAKRLSEPMQRSLLV